MSSVAAVSPTSGRLFEGTDVGSPGQTRIIANFSRDESDCSEIASGTPHVRHQTKFRNNVEQLLATAPKAC